MSKGYGDEPVEESESRIDARHAFEISEYVRDGATVEEAVDRWVVDDVGSKPSNWATVTDRENKEVRQNVHRARQASEDKDD